MIVITFVTIVGFKRMCVVLLALTFLAGGHFMRSFASFLCDFEVRGLFRRALEFLFR